MGFWERGGEFEVGLEVVCVVGFDVAGEGMKDGFEMDTTHSGLQCYGFKFLISISINQIRQSTLSLSSYSPLSTTLHAIRTYIYNCSCIPPESSIWKFGSLCIGKCHCDRI